MKLLLLCLLLTSFVANAADVKQVNTFTWDERINQFQGDKIYGTSVLPNTRRVTELVQLKVARSTRNGRLVNSRNLECVKCGLAAVAIEFNYIEGRVEGRASTFFVLPVSAEVGEKFFEIVEREVRENTQVEEHMRELGWNESLKTILRSMIDAKSQHHVLRF